MEKMWCKFDSVTPALDSTKKKKKKKKTQIGLRITLFILSPEFTFIFSYDRK